MESQLADRSLQASLPHRERETERERDTERHRETQRNTESEKHTERETNNLSGTHHQALSPPLSSFKGKWTGTSLQHASVLSLKKPLKENCGSGKLIEKAAGTTCFPPAMYRLKLSLVCVFPSQ